MVFSNLSFLLLSSIGVSTGTPQADFDAMDLKDQIDSFENSYQENKLDSEESLKMAYLYEKDQNRLKALHYFIKALDGIEPSSQMLPESSEEKALALEGLDLYVKNIDHNPTEVISEFRNRYESLIQKHPDWSYLHFFLSIADANDGEFINFFNRFYKAYCDYPESFLALRTRGVLHLKLSELLLGKDREQERKLAIKYLKQASELEFSESGLNRLLLFTASPDERKELLKVMIPMIIENEVKLPRKDITLYVRWLLQEDLSDLAHDFISSARGWYEYSRSLKVAENLLERSKRKIR